MGSARAAVLILLILTVSLPAYAENDRAFHPIGIFLDLNRRDFRREPIEQWTRLLQGLRALGFNTVVAKVDERLLARADALDFRVITGAHWDNPERTRAREKHPSLLAWLGIDEPGRTGRVAEAKQKYLDYRQVANRPLAVALFLPTVYGDANELADILLPDPYIFGHARPGEIFPDIRETGRRVALLRSQLHPGKRLWAVPQLYAWHPFFKRPPTADELEAQTILCLGEGAEGILYFAYNSGTYFPHPPRFEPLGENEAARPWELTEHDDLLNRLKRVNRISRHVLEQFGTKAERVDLSPEKRRYTWRKGQERFVVEIQFSPELRIDYTF